MFCGRHTEPRDFRFYVGAGGSTSGSSATQTLGVGGYLCTNYAIDYEKVEIGLLMVVTRSDGGPTPGGGASIQSDFFGLSQSVSFPGGGVPSTEFQWSGVRLYMMASGTWRIQWDSAVWIVNGGVQLTIGAGTYDTPVQPSPASVGMMGTYPEIGAVPICPEVPEHSTSGGFDPIAPPPGGRVDLSGSASASASGGWQFRVAGSGAWIDGGSASASSAKSYHTDGTTTATNSSQVGWAWACPGWAKAVVRMENDTLSLVFRGGLPQVRQANVDQTLDYSGGLPPPGSTTPYPATTGGISYTTLQGAQSQFLEIVADGTATIEAPLSASIAPSYNGTIVSTLTNSPDGKVDHETATYVGATGTGRNTSNPPTGDWDTTVTPGQCLGYLDHAWGAFRLFNTWCHPHWSYGDAFYGDSGQWPDAGWPGSDQDYSLPIAQQWMFHPALPTTDPNLRLRNFCVSSPLDQNGVTGLAQQSIGCFSWWGASVFEVDRFDDFPTTFVLDSDSQARWTFAGDGSSGATGTGSFDASGVTLTTGTTVDFALGSYTVKPYMAPHRADRLTIPGVTSGVAKVEAFLIGLDGLSVKIGETTGAATTVRIPRGGVLKSGGSWGHDMGGSAYSDTFSGAPSSDVSTAVAGDPEASGCYPFVCFGSGVRIRFVLTPVAGNASPMRLSWPTLLCPDASTLVGYADASPYRTILAPNGPLVRYGTATHYDPLIGLINPPEGDPAMDRRRELGDAYAWMDLWGYGRAWDYSALNQGPVDYEEGVEWTMIAHFWRDPYDQSRVTHSFAAQGQGGPVLCRVNSYRAVPPLGYWPTRARSKATDWRDTGDYCQQTYLLSPSRRPHITVDRPTLEKPSGTDLLTGDDTTAPTGWTVRYHRLATTGTEGYDDAATSGGKVWAKVRPYRGFVWWEGSTSSVAGTSLGVSPGGSIVMAYERDGTLRAKGAQNGYPDPWDFDVAVDNGPGDFRPRLAYRYETGTWLLVYERSGTGFMRESTDRTGRFWRDEQSMGYAYRPEIASSHVGGLARFHLEKVDGSSPVKYQLYVEPRADGPGLSFDAKQLVLDQGGNPIACELEGWGDIRAPYSATGGWLLAITPYGESDPVAFVSSQTKGLTFRRIASTTTP